MARKRSVLALLLAALMLGSSLVGCANNSDDSKDTTNNDTTASDTTALEEDSETDRTQIKDDLPTDLKYDGRTFTIYVNNTDQYEEYIFGKEDNEGDVLNDAVYERNLNVQDQLDFKLEYILNENDWQSLPPIITQLVSSGDSTYDVFFGPQIGIVTLVTQNVFVNAYDLDYLNFDQPWWANDYMDALSLSTDYRFFLVGDYNTGSISFIRALFVNKDLYSDLYGDPNELYEDVLAGTWTLDHLNTLVAGAYSDLDGNGECDTTDQLGYITNLLLSTTDGFVFGSDVEFTTRDEDGFVQLNMLNDDAVTLLERLNAFFHQTAVNINSNGEEPEIFAAGKALFCGNATLGYAKKLRDMEDNYGYLPNPKWDESQEEYRAIVHDTVLLNAVSGASQNLDMAGAVMEALNAESYRRVTPAYYESGLKLKYARDEISSQVVDLIKDSRTTNFIFAYTKSLNDIGQIYRTMITKNTNDYISTVNTKLSAAEQKLDDLIAFFKGE